jgi:disulfide oxidoreductase YuzD
MRKLYLLLLGLSLSTAHAQEEYWKNTGTAKTMLGKTYILSIFSSTPSPFSDAEIKRRQNGLHEATAWLTAQAKRYNQDISFKMGEFQDIKITSEILLDADKIDKIAEDHLLYSRSAIDVALEAAGNTQESLKEFVKKDCPECQNIVVLVYLNQKGRSYAHSYEKEMNPQENFQEGALLFNSQDDATLPSELAHEILHCFGAYDLYAIDENKPAEKKRQKLMEKTFPQDIMLELEYPNEPNNKKRIDNFTAYAIGWLSSYNQAWKKKIIPVQ